MILRICVLCLATAYLTDAYYLKYKAPNSKALKDIKGNLGRNRYPPHVHDVTQWLRNNRRKQLVLDRKDKRVEELLQELILLIEQSHPTQPEPKLCLKNDKTNEIICERHSNTNNQLNLVIPLPINKENKPDWDSRRIFNSRRYSDSSSGESRNGDSIETRPKRFEVVGNKKKNGKNFGRHKVHNDDSDGTKEVYGSEDKYNSNSEELSTEKPIKKKSKKKPVSAESDDERYSYIQGSRVMNSNRRQNRMTYFLPKRYHWTDDELRHLGYYWFEGT